MAKNYPCDLIGNIVYCFIATHSPYMMTFFNTVPMTLDCYVMIDDEKDWEKC